MTDEVSDDLATAITIMNENLYGLARKVDAMHILFAGLRAQLKQDHGFDDGKLNAMLGAVLDKFEEDPDSDPVLIAEVRELVQPTGHRAKILDFPSGGDG